MGLPPVSGALARSLLEVVARELGLYEELHKSLCTRGVARSSGELAEQIRLAARQRRELLRNMGLPEQEPSLNTVMRALPPEEAAVLAEMRRQIGAVMASLGAEGMRLANVA